MPKPIAAVVFDLDGTLIDSAQDLCAALNRLLGELGRAPLTVAAVTPMIGDGSLMLLRRALTATGDVPEGADFDALWDRFMVHYKATAADARLYPGARETLDGLAAHGIKLGLCTNKPEAPTRQILAALGLEALFGAVAGGDSLDVRKPDPEHLRWVLRAIGASAEESAMVGDNEHDIDVGRAAGLARVVAVSYGYARRPVQSLGADVVIDGLDALPAALGLDGVAAVG
jgi:phosphoglycolate phosphatase